MTEVYFSGIHDEIITQISTAKSSLKICVAWFTDVDIYQSIIQAQNKGVEVFIIIANHQFNKNSKVDFKEITQKNGYVGYIGNIDSGPEDKFMHNKFCIIDNDILITGSYNWTFKARINDENIMILKNQPNVISKFIDKFESIKPKYGFAIEGNKVKLLPIEQIMARWQKAPFESIQNRAVSISDKF